MKKALSIIVIVFIAATVFGCKKKKEDEPQATYESYSKADDASARNELDRVQDDIEKVYNSQDYANARTSGVVLPCGNVTINTSKGFTISYNGVNCGTRVLSGSVTATLVTGTKFSDVGAKLKVVFADYKVYYNSSKQYIIYNGTKYITNETGGTLVSLFTTTPNTVIHHVRGALQLQFDTTGTSTVAVTRDWNLFRKKTYTSNGTATGITFQFEGDTTIAGYSSPVSAKGTNREGLPFVEMCSTPFKWSNCGTTYDGPYVLKQGKIEHFADASSKLGANWIYYFAGTAGYTLNGATPVFDGSCSSSGYLMEWSAKNKVTNQSLVNLSAYQAY